MSDPQPETVPEDAEQDGGGDPETAEDTESRPEVSEDETADLSAVADQIHDEATQSDESGTDETDENATDGTADDPDGESGDEGGESDTSGSGGSSSRQWGDMYCSALTTGLNAVIEEHGKPGAEPIDEDMARDVHLDEAVNEWMEQRDRGEMEPGQEVALGTALMAGMVLMTKTDLPSQAFEGVEF